MGAILDSLEDWILWNFREIAVFFLSAIALVTVPLWLPPLVAARLLLFVARDLVVRFWQCLVGIDERSMVFFWTIVLPAPAVVGWLSGASIASLITHRTPAIVFAYLFALAPFFLAGYYFLYFFHPLKHKHWPLFLAAEEKILYDLRLSYLEHKARFRFWLLSRFLDTRRIIKGLSNEQKQS